MRSVDPLGPGGAETSRLFETSSDISMSENIPPLRVGSDRRCELRPPKRWGRSIDAVLQRNNGQLTLIGVTGPVRVGGAPRWTVDLSVGDRVEVAGVEWTVCAHSPYLVSTSAPTATTALDVCVRWGVSVLERRRIDPGSTPTVTLGRAAASTLRHPTGIEDQTVAICDGSQWMVQRGTLREPLPPEGTVLRVGALDVELRTADPTVRPIGTPLRLERPDAAVLWVLVATWLWAMLRLDTGPLFAPGQEVPTRRWEWARKVRVHPPTTPPPPPLVVRRTIRRSTEEKHPSQGQVTERMVRRPTAADASKVRQTGLLAALGTGGLANRLGTGLQGPTPPAGVGVLPQTTFRGFGGGGSGGGTDWSAVGAGSGGTGGRLGSALAGAGQVRSAGRGVGKGIAVESGGDAPEGGLDREAIRRVVVAHRAQVRWCYESRLAHAPDLAGQIVMEFLIDATGHVVRAAPVGSGLADPAVGACLAERVRGWTFPVPKGGGQVTVRYPFVFQRAGAGP